MRKRKKNRSRYPIEPLPKRIDSKIASRGFKALDSIFKRGLAPRDINAHFLLSWFAWGNGNAKTMAQIAGIHRNSVIYDFNQNFGSRETMGFRRKWLVILRENAKKSFADRMALYYKKVKAKPALNPAEIKGLADFWMQGAPRQVAQSYFILWALRRNWPLEKILKKLGRVYRDFCRYRLYAVTPGRPVYKWISMIPYKKEEWFIKRRGPAWEK